MRGPGRGRKGRRGRRGRGRRRRGGRGRGYPDPHPVEPPSEEGQDIPEETPGPVTGRRGGQIPEPVYLTFDELEAIRLVDLEGLYQKEAAQYLGISRRTLWSDLKEARRKVALALVKGLPIRILGGSQVIRQDRFDTGAPPMDPAVEDEGRSPTDGKENE